ncbi:MAG: hypothetical protein DRM98_02770 [Thermoplasmata archaeon]|nr:MAG: hypothetical protein DRM98_02770 [Thermoplasmata archaeon]
MIVSMLVISGVGAVAVSNEKQGYEVEKVSITFSQPKMLFEKETQFVTITMDDASSFLIKQNKPLLPKYVYVFEYPFGTNIKSVTCTPRDIKWKNLPGELSPSPVPVLAGVKTTKGERKSTKIVTDVYPETWYSYDISSGFNNNRERCVFVKIETYPVRYQPLEKSIEYASAVDVKVEYMQPYQNPTQSDEEYRFVILTADEYADELQSLVTHKISRGVSTKLVKLSEIYDSTYFPVDGRDTPEKIKYFIKNAIENWGTSYVMLVGNKDTFPMRETHVYMDDVDHNKFVSDLYYADIYDGEGNFSSWDTNENNVFGEYKEHGMDNDEVDLYPDVYLGRLACNSGTEVTTCVDKIIHYENSEAYSQDWFTNLVTVGGDSFIDKQNDPDFILEGETVNEKVIRIMDGFIPTKLWVSNGVLSRIAPSGVASINNAIETGCGFVDFSGHGNTNIWATHPHKNDNVWLPTPFGGYRNTDVQDLENNYKLPIIVIGACSVSKFNKDKNCFSWSFLSNPNGGGIGSFGATALGYSYIGKYVTYGLIEKLAIETFDAYDEGAITLGEMWGNGINSYLKNPGLDSDADYKTVEEWELFGDPTLAIAEESSPPVKPEPPQGPTTGGVKKELTYTASTTDPDGDKIYYLFDWGDGTYSGWLGPKNSGQNVEATHTWTEKGDYRIRVKAKDEHGVQSEWSSYLSVHMPRSKTVINPTILQKIMEKNPSIYRVINEILRTLQVLQ